MFSIPKKQRTIITINDNNRAEITKNLEFWIRMLKFTLIMI